jgi:[acyl-carrier-protein] S-malonyltransferase
MKIAMIFPGYGSQYVGMEKEFYDQHRIVQEYFEEASNCLPINFVKLCFASSDMELAQLNHAYPALFLVSCSIFALLKEQGIHPTLIAGFNQGEYAAMFAASSITFPDGLYLLSKFSSFYQEALKELHAEMLDIHDVPTLELRDLCEKAAKKGDAPEISVYFTETNHFVSGTSASIDRLRDLIYKDFPDATMDSVPVEGGLHSSLMQSVVDNYKIYLEKVDFKDPALPLISGIDGRMITAGADLKTRVTAQIDSPIMWTRVADVLAAHDLIIEVGPGSKLTEMLQKTHPNAKVISVNKQSDIDKIKSMMPQPEEPAPQLEE